MKLKIIVLNITLIFLLLSPCVEKKQKYWVYFNLNQKLNPHLIDSLSHNYSELGYHSKWLNAIAINLSSKEYSTLNTSPFIDKVIPIKSNFKILSNQLPTKSKKLSFALEQINGSYFIDNNITGKGVKIGIIDGGFLDADSSKFLSHIFKNGLVENYKDYITPLQGEYRGSKHLDDNHGTEVWSLIGGINGKRKVQFGLATEASYYLARTDHGNRENRSEEENLIAALEWLDSLDVKLVNISLGYTNEYDNPKENYKPSQMDGKSTFITKAVQIASDEKNILIIVSAGNDGANDWKTLSAPADAKGVLTVGATMYNTWGKMDYSSTGSESLTFLKPNISCFANDGTSFSAPIITGLAACIMQIDSSLTSFHIKSIIEKSAHLYPYGNNYIGYGVPNCKTVLDIINATQLSPDPIIISNKDNLSLIIPSNANVALLFHKSDSIHVISQQRVKFFKNILKISKPKGVKFTTVTIQNYVKEIEWK